MSVLDRRELVTPTGVSPSRIGGLDGVRALAVVAVLVFHASAAWAPGGFAGVDVFFVVSGFLITTLLLREQETTGRLNLPAFYVRRARRLLPAAVVVVIVAGLAALAVGGDILVGLLASLFGIVTLTQNWVMLAAGNDYFAQAGTGLFDNFWSLAIEEQFYLFYPLGLIVLHRLARGRGMAVILPVTLAVLAASFALGWFATGWKPQAAFYLLPTRAWELLAGGALAMALRDWRPPAVLVALAGPAGLALVALTLVLHGPGTPFPGWFAALPVLGSVALLVSGLRGDNPTSRMLSARPMVWLGRISYPLYLVHWPILIAQRNSLPETGYGWRLFGLGLSVVLAWAILRLVETPIRSGRVLRTPRAFLAGAGAVTGALGLACLAGWQTGGLPQRFDPQVAAWLAYAEDRATQYEACDWPVPACPLGPKGEPTVALVGDSHAQALAGAFDIWLNRVGQPGVLMFGSACLPVAGTGDPRCAAFAESAIARAEASPTIRTVFLLSIWRQPYGGEGLTVDGRFLRGQAAVRPAFEAALTATVTRLRAAGKTVILVEPLYAAPHRVPVTLAHNLAFGTDWPVDTPLADHRRDFALLHAAFDRARQAGALRLSLIDDLCRSGTCPGTLDGTPLFSDGNHIRFGMSPVFADILDKKLAALDWRL